MSYAVHKGVDVMDDNNCHACGKPTKDNEELCSDCQIEEFIRECSAQIEM